MRQAIGLKAWKLSAVAKATSQGKDRPALPQALGLHDTGKAADSPLLAQGRYQGQLTFTKEPGGPSGQQA